MLIGQKTDEVVGSVVVIHVTRKKSEYFFDY